MMNDELGFGKSPDIPWRVLFILRSVHNHLHSHPFRNTIFSDCFCPAAIFEKCIRFSLVDGVQMLKFIVFTRTRLMTFLLVAILLLAWGLAQEAQWQNGQRRTANQAFLPCRSPAGAH